MAGDARVRLSVKQISFHLQFVDLSKFRTTELHAERHVVPTLARLSAWDG